VAINLPGHPFYGYETDALEELAKIVNDLQNFQESREKKYHITFCDFDNIIKERTK
jgi:hypothetical protein